MANDFTITVNSNQPIQQLHIHVTSPEQLDRLELAVSALTDAVATVSSNTQALLATTAEVLKDVQRLITDGDTTGAVTALQGAASSLADAQTQLSTLDAAVEAADPEPVPPTP